MIDFIMSAKCLKLKKYILENSINILRSKHNFIFFCNFNTKSYLN